MILTGERNERQFVEPDDYRMGYSVRPAYRRDPKATEKWDAYWALIAIGVVAVMFLVIRFVLPVVR